MPVTVLFESQRIFTYFWTYRNCTACFSHIKWHFRRYFIIISSWHEVLMLCSNNTVYNDVAHKYKSTRVSHVFILAVFACGSHRDHRNWANHCAVTSSSINLSGYWKQNLLVETSIIANCLEHSSACQYGFENSEHSDLHLLQEKTTKQVSTPLT